MSYTVEKIASNKVKFTFVESAEAFDAAMHQSYLKNRSKINVPGFRKGKAPRKLIENMYGEAVFYDDAFEIIAQPAYDEAVKAENQNPVDRPEVDIQQIGSGKELKYTIEVFVKPDITLGDYKGVEVRKNLRPVTEDAINARIDSDVERASTTQDVTDRAVENGDIVNLNYAGTVDGVAFDGGTAENQSLTIGSNMFIPGFEEQMVGMQIGEEKDLNITFPTEYAPELAGKDVVFKVKLNSLTMPELPELDDEFAKDVSEFDTLEEYKADIRANLLKKKTERAESAFKSEILRQAAENVQAEIPAVMIDEKVEETLRNYASQFGMNDRNVSLQELTNMMGITDEVMQSSVRPGAEFQVKTDLLLNAVMEAEKLDDNEEAFAAYVEKVAGDVGATAEQLKQYFGEEFMKNEFRKELATNLIVDSAVVKAAE